MLATRLQNWSRICSIVPIRSVATFGRSITTIASRQSAVMPPLNTQTSTEVTTSGSQDGTRLAPFIIGVAGGTASGKTSVCRKIMKQLRKDVPEEQGVIINLSQDSFYRNLTPQETADIANFNFDHPNAFAFDEIIHCLGQLKQANPVEIPQYDFVTSSRTGQIPVQHADVILFDGILAFYTPGLQELFDLKIFVDTDADTRLARRVRRDIMHRGRDVLQVLDQYERTVKPSFESYILPTKKHADIIIPRGAENEIAIDLILQHIKFRLSSRVVSPVRI
ncbi:TPA: UMP-CMP kinase, variant 2 [Trebouxia sp. C0006]